MVTITHSNPFPGLRSYEYEDSRLFFGRESHISEAKRKLFTGRFLALIGSSGSGKSSLVKAGLIPSLADTEAGQEEWSVVLFKPGAKPIKSFVTALKARLRKEGGAWEGQIPEDFEATLLSNPEAVMEPLAPLLSRNLLLVIDQFEEIFRYESASEANDKAETQAFIRLLLRLIHQTEVPIYAVITMRSDYLDQCTDFKGLTEAINLGYYLLPKMSQSEMREAITQPVEVSGARITPDLVQNLLAEMAAHSDYLPIMQHALMRTWDRWRTSKSDSDPISLAEYEAIGTMKNAITLHAEEIYIQRLDEKRRLAAEKLFKTLIVLGPNDTPTLHPTPLREILGITGLPDYLLTDVIQVFRERGASFLTPQPSVKLDLDSILDVSVERILSLWERSRLWIEEELESAKLYKQLSYSAQLYQDGKAGLWVNPELQMGLKWLAERQPTLEWAQRYDPFFERGLNFLEYSKKQFELEVQQKENRQRTELRRARTFAAILGFSSLVSLLFLIVAMVLRTQAEQSEKLALDKESLALRERKRAEEQTKEAVSQQKIAEQQGVIAELQKALTEEQKAIAVEEQEKAIRESIAAQAARRVAEEQRLKADSARAVAVRSQQETERQREVAVGAQKESERQKENALKAQREAEVARNDALQQRAKAIARFIATQSYQMQAAANDELSALLALHAYQFNRRNGGEKENPDVFNALSKAGGAKATLQGHTDIVRIVAESPVKSSAQFATAGDDGVINIWNYNASNERPLRLINPKQTFKSIRSLAFSASGSTLFVGTSNGQLVRWDSFASGSLPSETVIGHDGAVIFLQLQKEGNELLSISNNGQLRRWDLANKRFVLRQNVNTGLNITSAHLAPNGKQVYLSSASGKLIRLDLDDLAKAPTEYDLGRLRGRITALAFRPDGTQLFVGSSEGALYMVSVRNDEPIRGTTTSISGAHTSTISQIVFSPDGTRVATSSYDWKIKVWSMLSDLSKQQPVTLSDFDYWVMNIDFTKDGTKLIACGADKTVRIWDINSEALFLELANKVSGDLSPEDWDKYIGKDIPYEKLSRRLQ
ncbi:hypothetical protein GCM10027275_31260 [Rhabdobacter roseus]|uniref:WD40 repeat protein/energy-coupling factor transporter ATP-binding protein EcfA2 n=1 Tax=Rhabdobacter roseus TaxID=1655419 RepID=A0A840TQA9_9BACT|nr:NACHT domain-containing protein [Rhabdobacter roseus]MBB5285085.1 WD40 repeat protein/energy-coupling factor transporter ATP-binding protein EcfA2 [Rhabdobacter roseus]